MPPPLPTSQLGIHFRWIPGSSILSTLTQPLSCQMAWHVAQLDRAWQAICQVEDSSPSLSHRHFSPLLFHVFISHLISQWLWLRLRSDLSLHLVLHAHHNEHASSGICFGYIPGSSALSTWTRELKSFSKSFTTHPSMQCTLCIANVFDLNTTT